MSTQPNHGFPWIRVETSHGNVIRTCSGNDVATTTRTDAARIVASVNALADLPIEMLEQVPFVAPARIRYAELSRQRDALAAMLRGVFMKMRNDSGSTDPMEPFSYDAEWEEIAKKADAALALIEARKPFEALP